MKKISIPAFGEKECFENRENNKARVFYISGADEKLFDDYGALFEENGYVKKEGRKSGLHKYESYYDGSRGVFLNYFSAVCELSIVIEENCLYFSYEDVCQNKTVTPQITQVSLEDYGMSYVIRLSDGRFIIIDGGCKFEPDEDRLFKCLKDGCCGEVPVIASWIMSHPHSDHFHCFLGFMDKYSNEVKIEKFMFNFPEPDDFEHYPAMKSSDARFDYDTAAYVNIPEMLEKIETTGAVTYMLHTGQRYIIGDAVCEIIASVDDTIHTSEGSNINAASAVVRMELAGQVILWTTDASFSIAKIPQKYGNYLKSDILQVPHHGFQCGDAKAEIVGYNYIKPKVCLLPVSEYNAYTAICAYKESAGYLMRNVGVEEIITGEPQRTINLPYSTPDYAKAELERKYLKGHDNAGACTWVFSELSTACEEDFNFTLLNMTNSIATVWIDIFFEDVTKNIRFIKTEVRSLKKICITGEDVDNDAVYFNWCSLKEKGIPENASFAVRFMSDIPIVVSHRLRAPAYFSPNR